MTTPSSVADEQLEALGRDLARLLARRWLDRHPAPEATTTDAAQDAAPERPADAGPERRSAERL